MVEYADRAEAGAVLARALAAAPRAGQGRPLVLGLPRGGVPVAAMVATALGGELDVLPVRKVSVPGQPELAMGAVAEGGTTVVDERMRNHAGVADEALAARVAAATRELQARAARWRSNREPRSPAGRDVVIVDDGLATGSTALAAVRAALQAGACSVTVAAPVGSAQAIRLLESAGARVVCPAVPPDFRAVGLHYVDFAQVGDAEVIRLLTGD